MLNAEAIALLARYLTRLRCLDGLPAIGSKIQREPLLVGFPATKAGRPMQPGINQRLVQRVVRLRAHEPAQRRLRVGIGSGTIRPPLNLAS